MLPRNKQKKNNRYKQNKLKTMETQVYNLIRDYAITKQWYGNCIPISIILSECLSKKEYQKYP